MNSVMDGKGRIIPGLSVSLRCSNTAAAAAVTGNCTVAAAVSADD